MKRTKNNATKCTGAEKNIADIIRIYNKLYASFGPQHWWPAKTPFEMMTGAILTQNTAWTNVEKALANFSGRLSPQFIRDVKLEELAAIIRPSGFFNQKAPRLKRLAEWFLSYNCDTARLAAENGNVLRKQLLSLSGVGPETADSILLYAIHKPFFVVDAYTRRIFTRMGYNIPDEYENIRAMLERAIPHDEKLYGEFHALIVKLAKLYCKSIPVCTGCPLAKECNKQDNCCGKTMPMIEYC